MCMCLIVGTCAVLYISKSRRVMYPFVHSMLWNILSDLYDLSNIPIHCLSVDLIQCSINSIYIVHVC